MINSMTGFGEGEVTTDKGTVSIAIKSVNHRYLDMNFRLPFAFHAFEPALRKTIQARLSRGKLDISVYFKSARNDDGHLHFDREAAETAFQGLKELQEMTGTIIFNKAAVLAQLDGVFAAKPPERADESMQEVLISALDLALDHLSHMRAEEGSALCDNLQALLSQMEATLEEMATEMEAAPAYLEKKLKERIETLLGEQMEEYYPGQRLAAEVALLIDRQAIDEEYVRLKSHVRSFADALNEKEAVGKRLDFLAQEMNREANTIAAKGAEKINRLALDLKHIIEQIREQVQNIE